MSASPQQVADHARLRATIETAFERRQTLTPESAGSDLLAAVEEALGLLDRGELRVAEQHAGRWSVNEWLKKAVLLYFRTHHNRLSDAGYARFYDKVPLKFASLDADEFAAHRSARRASRHRAPRGLHRSQRRTDALLRQYRRLYRFGHHGRYLGHGGLVRADRQERAPVGRGRHWRRARTAPGRARRSSRTIVLSARAQKSSREW